MFELREKFCITLSLRLASPGF